MATGSHIRRNVHGYRLSGSPYLDLRSPGLFASWPGIGLTMIVLGSILFVTLAYGISMANGPVLQWDLAATQAIHAQLKNIPASLVEYVLFGFFIGKEIVIAIGVILTIYFLYKRFWRELALVLVGLGGGTLLWYFLNQYFDRPRPSGQMAVLPLTDPSFPSGLALAAVLCYGLLVYLLVPGIASRAIRWLVSIALLLVIVLVGFSAVVSGSHYVTDVIAGYALAVAWSGLVYTLIESYLLQGTARKQRSSQETASDGLHSPGLFRSKPLIGLAAILLGTLVFAGLSYNLIHRGPLLQLDTAVNKDLIAAAQTAPPVINEIMIFGFFVGKQVVLLIVTILSIYFIYKHYWRELAMLLLSSAAGSFVWNFLIAYFARPRPSQQTGLVIKSIPSFPSGHAMSALICYGFLGYLLFPKMPSRFWKWTVAVAALLIMLFIGFSRVFQGGHYLTDVIGGYALGLAWAGSIYLLLENIFWRRKVKDVKEE